MRGKIWRTTTIIASCLICVPTAQRTGLGLPFEMNLACGMTTCSKPPAIWARVFVQLESGRSNALD